MGAQRETRSARARRAALAAGFPILQANVGGSLLLLASRLKAVAESG